jgi:hypothetical protein
LPRKSAAPTVDANEETVVPAKRAARSKTKVLSAEPATPREVREYLLANSANLPDDVTVASRGRLSGAAKTYFTDATGRTIAE